jgi:hypothetical protein
MRRCSFACSDLLNSQLQQKYYNFRTERVVFGDVKVHKVKLYSSKATSLQKFILRVNRGSSVSIVTTLWAGRPKFDSWQALGLLSFATAFRPALPPPPPPETTRLHRVQRLRRRVAVSPFPLYVFMTWYVIKYSGWGVKLTTHLYQVPRSKNEWSYTCTPYAFMAWFSVKKAQGRHYLYQGQLYLLHLCYGIQ